MEDGFVEDFVDETVGLGKDVLPVVGIADIPVVEIKVFHKLYYRLNPRKSILYAVFCDEDGCVVGD